MKSDARSHLHKRFETLRDGELFQLVNTLMGAALPRSEWFIKTPTGAINRTTGLPVVIRPGTIVETR